MKAGLIWEKTFPNPFFILTNSCSYHTPVCRHSPQRWHDMFAWGNNCTELWLTGQLNKTWTQVWSLCAGVFICCEFANVWPSLKIWYKLMILPPLPILKMKCTEGKGFAASAYLFSLDRGQDDMVALLPCPLLRLALCHRTFLYLLVLCSRYCQEKADPFKINQRPLTTREVGSNLNMFW